MGAAVRRYMDHHNYLSLLYMYISPLFLCNSTPTSLIISNVFLFFTIIIIMALVLVHFVYTKMLSF